MFKLSVALIHSPVVNRNKEIVTSSVTNLDLHDIARAGCTYGIERYFVVHPSGDQQALNRRIINHWQGAYGEHANPTRRPALDLIDLVQDLDEGLEYFKKAEQPEPMLIGTSARVLPTKTLQIVDLKAQLETRPVVLVFGTAYGLSDAWMERLEGFLPPIYGPTKYNHLSVRSAVSIYLDRIFGS